MHRSFEAVIPHLPHNPKQICLGKSALTQQSYRWAWGLEYRDSHDRLHPLNLLECSEQSDAQQEKPTKYLWLTNFTLTSYNVDKLANQGGRLRWKIENKGFNVQWRNRRFLLSEPLRGSPKNGGFHPEHPYSQNENARKVFYLLLQIAHLIAQLMEKGSLLRQAFPQGWGPSKNLAFRLPETMSS